ncbi:Mas-related G-protein coupled receptor member D [Dissostichus eleginoides]|uniref:Mas-related G-protein coupled receptor member D n=1 Tax=Dissostichus eleginoides TaxID=100907 RepID=A0AAD9BEK8_DISEL|nr:Mas-related G-protein coupled receptor member D [Dissostichus eleginoides]
MYFCMGLEARGRFRQSLAGVYRRALADYGEGQVTQSHDKSLDDSSGSKHSTAIVAGSSLTTVEGTRV